MASVSVVARPGTNWSIAVVNTPSFQKADWLFIGVSFFFTASIIVAAVTFATIEISLPLRKIGASMEAITHLNFSRHPHSSRVTEINGILTTFDRLRTGKINSSTSLTTKAFSP